MIGKEDLANAVVNSQQQSVPNYLEAPIPANN